MLAETLIGVSGVLLISQGQTRSSCHNPRGPSWFLEFTVSLRRWKEKCEEISPVSGLQTPSKVHTSFQKLKTHIGGFVSNPFISCLCGGAPTGSLAAFLLASQGGNRVLDKCKPVPGMGW